MHQRTVQRVRDVPFDGQVTVVWVKRRWRCAESACGRVTFTEHTDQVPVRARMTTRVKDAVVVAVATEARAVWGVAAAFGLSWASVHRQVRVAGARLAAAWAARPRLVRWLGIDEHRFRSVRWFRDEAGAWRRLEPWSITFVDLSTGAVVGVVDGRDSALCSFSRDGEVLDRYRATGASVKVNSRLRRSARSANSGATSGPQAALPRPCWAASR